MKNIMNQNKSMEKTNMSKILNHKKNIKKRKGILGKYRTKKNMKATMQKIPNVKGNARKINMRKILN